MHKNPARVTAYSLFAYYRLLLELQLFVWRATVSHTASCLIQGWMNENVTKGETK